MFEKRTDLIRFLAVNEAGRIAATAERLAITQPTLTRDIARLARCVGGRLFERLPGSVRLTALSAPLPFKQRDRPVETDGQHVVIGRDRDIGPFVSEPRTVPPHPGQDRPPRPGVDADLPGEGEQGARDGQGEALGARGPVS